MSRLCALFCAVFLLCSLGRGRAQQTSATAPGISFQGLRSSGAHGSFKASATLADGTLILLYDQGDGVRLLRTDAAAGTVLAQAEQGANGDSGTALSLDSTGNIYVAGTSSSGVLAGTPGTAFPGPADTSLNSFLAKFDPELRLVFLTFLGAGRTEVTGLAATSDAIFVTGANYSGTIPTTAGCLQRTPPNSNYGSGNGFVQRFTTDGSALQYGTYLNGVNGGSVPAAIVAATDDSVYVAGETSASTFPVLNALQPTMADSVSGFISKLAPDGSTLLFSTFIAGSGLSSLALDPAANALLATGNLSWGQFPVGTASAPVAQTPYQSLLRLSLDGQTVVDSAVLQPGTQSSITPGPNSTAWITGPLALPLTPETMGRGPGDGYVLHVTSADVIDQLQRIGGSATDNPVYAHLNTTLAAPTLSLDGQHVTVAGSASAQTDPTLRADQSFDLGLHAGTSSLLPSTPQDILPTSCVAAQGCTGTGALLTQLAANTSLASLTLSTGDLPNVTVHNTGSTPVTGVSVSVSGFTASTNCLATLAPFAQCTLVLIGTGPGSISVTSASNPALNLAIPSLPAQVQPLAFSTAELDFGIVTPSSSPATRVITVQNLGVTVQTFSSTPDNVPSAVPYTLAEVGSSCPGPPSAHTLAPQASCTVQVGLSASSSAQNDGPVQASWTLGTRNIVVTGFTQAASLSLSSSEVDFGTQTAPPSARLPRYLYLSNSSPVPVAHNPVSLPPQSPLSVLDGCPATLLPNSVCQITLRYSQPNAPVFDSTTLTLDAGLSVLLTGETAASAPSATLTAVSPLLTSPASVLFATAVPVSQASTEVQSVQITNPSSASIPLTTSVLGDFNSESTCPASLPAGATCVLNLTFGPSEPGIRVGVLHISTTPEAEPTTVRLEGTGLPILPSSANGSLDLGQTTVGEPVVAWVQLAGSFPQFTAATAGPGFTVALLADDGNGHGTLPPTAFTPTTSAQCTGCWLAVQFLPEAPSVADGTVQLTSSAGGHPFQLNVHATAIPATGLVLAPAQGNFGAVAQGASSAPLSLTLTNLPQNANAAFLQSISASGNFAVVGPAAGPDCAALLQPTASCSVEVIFTPTAKGERTGTLTVTTSAGTASVHLLGVGSPITPAPSQSVPSPPSASGVAVFPTQADFGPQAVSTVSQVRQFTLRNTSTAAQTLSLTSTSNFPLAQSAAQASPCATLAPGASCTFAVVFVPTEGGPLTGSVTITAQAQDDPAAMQTVLYLRGYGIASEGFRIGGGTDPHSPVDFGNLVSGSSATQNITLTNTGTSPHSLRRLQSTPPFQITSTCTQAIMPGGSCDLTVAYVAAYQLPDTATQTPRTDLGTLLIESDTDSSPTIVYLKAIALPSASAPDPHALALPTYTLTQTALTFANAQAGSRSIAQTITATNSGTLPVIFAALLPPDGFDADTTCSTLPVGQSCTITVTFQPAQPSSAATVGSLLVSSNAATALQSITVLASAFATQLKLSPDILSFGDVAVGSSAQQSVTVANPTGLPASLGTVAASGDFTVRPGTCPTDGPLTADQTCTLAVTFTPSAAGARTGSLTPTGGAAATPSSIAVSGTGIAGQLQVQPTTLDFGGVPLTTASSRTLTLTNVGSAPLQYISFTIAGRDAPNFTINSPCGTTELAVGASCTVQLSFVPVTPGTRSALLSIASNDPASPTTVPLAGTGSQPPGFTLTVNGESSGAANISSGGSAVFPLTLAAQGGYAGAITLHCTPVAPAPNAACALAAAQMTLSGGTATSSVNVSTLSGLGSGALLLPFGFGSLLPFASRRLRFRAGRRYAPGAAIAILSVALTATLIAGCGRGPGSIGNPYTPPGTYTYQVTAVSTSGPALSSSVMLSVTVH